MDFERKESTFFRFVGLLSIPFLLIIALIAGFLRYIPLKAELHSVIIVSIIFFIFLFFITHNAWLAFIKYKNKMPQILDEIDTHILKNELVIRGRKKSFCSIDEFFEKNIKTIRNDNFAGVASSIFPTLGILGTFTAIAISMPNFSVESKEALENEITILLSGVGTAFYASIYGIFLSLWWIFFEKRGLSKTQNYIEEVKLSYEDLLWTKDEIELLKLNDSNASINLLLERIEDIVSPAFIYKLDEVIKSKLELVKRLDDEYRSSEQKLVQNYTRLTKLFEDSAFKQEKLLSDFDNLNKILEENSKANQLNQKALKNEIYATLSSFELVSQDLKELGQDLIEAKDE